MATALSLGGILLAIASGVLACVAFMSPIDYRLVTAPESVVETAALVDEGGEVDARRSAEQLRIGVLSGLLAVAAAVTQIAAAGWIF